MKKLPIFLISWLLTLTNVQVTFSNSPADAPDISVDSDTLDFGQVFLNVTDSLQLVVENNGSQDLLVSSAAAQPAGRPRRRAAREAAGSPLGSGDG